MHQPARQTAVTYRDGEAPRVVDAFREQIATRMLELPRRKRYTPHAKIDLVVHVPDDDEPNAPRTTLRI
jgi:hypothetical protein